MEHKMRSHGHNQIRCEVVTTYEQLLHAYAVRSICFMEEHRVKAQHNFDGNDYQATHMIVYAGDEPVGALRIRWFKDFAKLERLAFREAYRNAHVLKTFVFFAFDHIARKGYDKAISPCAAEICAAVEDRLRMQERRGQAAGLLRRSRRAVYRTRQRANASPQRHFRTNRRNHSVPDRGILGLTVQVRNRRCVTAIGGTLSDTNTLVLST